MTPAEHYANRTDRDLRRAWQDYVEPQGYAEEPVTETIERPTAPKEQQLIGILNALGVTYSLPFSRGDSGLD